MEEKPEQLTKEDIESIIYKQSNTRDAQKIYEISLVNLRLESMPVVRAFKNVRKLDLSSNRIAVIEEL